MAARRAIASELVDSLIGTDGGSSSICAVGGGREEACETTGLVD